MISIMNKNLIFMILAMLVLACPACAKKPVLYPNEQYKEAGEAKVSDDIAYCMEFAEKSVGNTSKAKTSVKTGVKGGLIGGAVGLGIGIVTGSPGSSALAGAAGGAAGGAVGGAMQDNPDPLYRKFVERCLREKGYETMGWK
jgi:outer membrane lipoprotein SlyB